MDQVSISKAKSGDAHFHVIDNPRTEPTSSALVCRHLEDGTALIKN